MFNLRIGGIIAGTAFVISLLLGLFNRTTMPHLLFRPIIFAFLFFIITALVNILLSRFLPELMEDNDMTDIPTGPAGGLRPGSRVNITEGDYDVDLPGSPRWAAPNSPRHAYAQPDDSDEGIGNISDLGGIIAGSNGDPSELLPVGMDQKVQDDYTKAETPEIRATQTFDTQEHSGDRSFSEDFSDSEETLPDLDSMAGAFLPVVGEEEPDTTEYSVSTPTVRKPLSSSKNSGWSGDFNAKDLAKGLQTILSKDKEG